MSFADYKCSSAQQITVIEGEYYPDYLEEARELYSAPLQRFAELVDAVDTPAELLVAISEEPLERRIQLLRIFRKYVSPDTSVEMLKRKRQIPDIVRDFGGRFRCIDEVRRKLRSRPSPDEVIMALLYEYKERGTKGYELTERFFRWFRHRFGDAFVIQGPMRAGPDLVLSEILPGFGSRIPADFLISRKDRTPLVVGFARYDSDRGGAQEDDRPGGNRDKVTEILRYGDQRGTRVKVLFVNDGPGLLLGSMWDDYAALEEYGKGRVMVCTLKMLDSRLTEAWLES